MKITFDPKVNASEGWEIGEGGHMRRRDVCAGAACWANGRSGETEVPNAVLRFACPCGCGHLVACPVKPEYGNCWKWNGSVDLPSLQPSIQVLAPCRWHGYLTNGEFKKS